MRRAAPVLQAVLAAAVGTGLLLGSVVLSTGVGGPTWLPGVPDASSLDYARQSGEITPLSDRYVDAVLGAAPGQERDGQGGGGPAAAAEQAGTLAVGALGLEPTQGEEARETVLRRAFTNDDFARAVEVTSLPFRSSTNTRGAGREPGEPGACSGGGTAWYRYRATASALLLADTAGTRYVDALAVYTGTSLRRLRQVACSGTSLGGAAQVGVRVVRGSTYWFQVAAPLGGGEAVFRLRPVGPTRQADGGTQAYVPPALSGDGRWLLFAAPGSERHPGSRRCPSSQDGWCRSLYRTDLVTGRTEVLLSTSTAVPGPLVGQTAAGTRTWFNDLSTTPDGRYVAFSSDDPALVRGDTNATNDVFVLDTRTRKVERVSVDSQGRQSRFNPAGERLDPDNPLAVTGAFASALSADGRFVAFLSDADDLVPEGGNGTTSVYRHDRLTGRTELVSVDSRGQRLQDHALFRYVPAMSSDGSRLAFLRYPVGSLAVCQVQPASERCLTRVLVWDAATRRTRDRTPHLPGRTFDVSQVSLSSDGRSVVVAATVVDATSTYAAERTATTLVDVAGGRTRLVDLAGLPTDNSLVPQPAAPVFSQPTLSADGRYVVFDTSNALVPEDLDLVTDVYVRDTRTGRTRLLSVDPRGQAWTVDAYHPLVSADARTVAYLVDASAFHVYVHRSPVPGEL